MILTRTTLNPQRQGARKLLGSPQAMHAAILSGFPPGAEPGRVLWRLDQGQGRHPVVYVVSAAAPDLAHVDEQAGWPSRRMAESVSYQPFLDGLASGQQWNFRITVNPTHRVSRGGRSQVLGHVTVAQQTGWLFERAEAMGVRFGESEEPTFTLVDREVVKFRRQAATVTLSRASFMGRLEVVEPDLLRQVLTQGVGRGKAYGCGLMTLAGA